MANASNIYAEKLYSEHPNILWSLDEQSDFASYLTKSNNDLNNWTTFNCTKSIFDNTQSPYGPIASASSTKITANTGSTSISISTPLGVFVSPTTNSEFTIGFWIYSNNTTIKSITIGYQDGAIPVVAQGISTTSYGSWKYFSANFTPSSVASGYIFLQVQFTTPNIATTGEYDFIVNGVSIGYKTEEFNEISTGIIPVTVPSTISTSETLGVEAYNYGVQKQSGYYIVHANKLLARNTSMPMAYGSGNCTVIGPHNISGRPSLIIPGAGFMNEVGENTTLTFETWFRINSNAITPKRIFGPVNSVDGLYVNGPFLILKIGSLVKSHYVGEWFRPMLLQISMSTLGTSLFVNGKEVISLSYKHGDIAFLTKYDSSGKDQDYLGFYAYSDVPTIEVDSIAIYPYMINETIALRRYVYGQGIQFPKNLDSAYSGQTMLVDYSFAGYTNNYNYPQLGKWQSGIQDNLTTHENYIESAQVTSVVLPDFKIGNSEYTSDNMISDMYTMNVASPDSNGKYICLLPTGVTRDWSTATSYLLFDTISKISTDVQGIYGVFKSPSTSSGTQEKILIKIQNTITNDYIKISLTGTTLKYLAKIGTASEFSLTSNITVNTSTAFTVGLNFNTLLGLSTANFQNFFGNKNQLSFYVGGDYNGNTSASSTTFYGSIYCVNFLNSKTLDSTIFNSSTGVIGTTLSTSLIAAYPTYGLKLGIVIDNAYLDIKTNSYWQDYVPISVLSRYVSDTSGNQVYDLDYVQLNVDYPQLEIFSGTNYDTTSAIVKTYATFQYLSDGANKSSSTYTTTVSMPQNNQITPAANLDWKTSKYEFVNNAILYMPTVLDSLKTIQDLAIVIHLEMYVDGVILNPVKVKTLQISPKTLNSNVTGTYTLNNEIGTRFGTNLYPLTVTSGNKFYDSVNPFIINKEVSQYLNLTNNSGIKLAGTINGTERSLLSIINPNAISLFNISSMQMSLLWNEQLFPTSEQKVLEINDSLNGTTRFYLSATNAAKTRGKISGRILKGGTITNIVGSGVHDITYTTSNPHGISVNDRVTVTKVLPIEYRLSGYYVSAVPTPTTFKLYMNTAPSSAFVSSGEVEKFITSEVSYYWNGNLVYEPYLNIKEWGMLGLVFTNLLKFDGIPGDIRLMSNMLVNNMSYYQLDNSKLGEQLISRTWNETSSAGDWNSWYLSSGSNYNATSLYAGTWINIYQKSGSIIPAVLPSTTYKVLTGTNKSIFDSSNYSGKLRSHSYQYKVYTNFQTQSQILRPQ